MDRTGPELGWSAGAPARAGCALCDADGRPANETDPGDALGTVDADGDGDGATDGTGLGGAGAGLAGAGAAAFFGIGWIDTYSPSQIIRFGAYFQAVKKPLNWAGVSFVFGGMS